MEADGQHSVARSVALHLLPGALITTFYALLAPVVRGFGFPSLMAIFLSILFVLAPFEIGYLLLEEIFQTLRSQSIYKSMIDEQKPILRTLQFVAEYRKQIFAAL